jgi:hypothetical protein
VTLRIPDARTRDNAILAWLNTELDRTVFDGYVGPRDDSALPYAVMYAAGHGRLDGPVGAPHEDDDPLIQITSVGGSREQAQWMAGKVRHAFLDPGLTITGRALLEPVELVLSLPVRRDDQVNPPLFYVVEQFRVRTTPA